MPIIFKAFFKFFLLNSKSVAIPPPNISWLNGDFYLKKRNTKKEFKDQAPIRVWCVFRQDGVYS